ncbi:MAG: hypothetical protein HY650_13695 [Acidobacteria bacterium]|nr:hypothetical protein [Acidobacteriota bacterium]
MNKTGAADEFQLRTALTPSCAGAYGSGPLVLYQKVLDVHIWDVGDLVRAKRPKRLPVVLTRQEVRAVLKRVDGTPKLVCLLLYEAGLRLLGALRIRVKDTVACVPHRFHKK